MNPFDTEGFSARWFCGAAWEESPWLGWLHIGSDILTCLAYYAVPAVVFYFVSQRRNLKFPPIFYIFLSCVFVTCGTQHLIEAIIFWSPIYRLAGVVKLVTAVVSCAGVVVLSRVLPIALDLKSSRDYQNILAQREQAQASLEHERFLLRTLLDHLPEAIYFKDTEGRFTRISKLLATRLGLASPEEAVGRSDADFFSADYAAQAREDERNLIRTGQPLLNKEEHATWPNGESTWVATTKVPLRDEAGQITGSIGISHDITAIKQAEQEMSQAREAAESANRAKSGFLANMSHEIRTPMNAIIGMTEMVLDSSLTPVQRDYLSTVLGSAEWLLAIINEILDFSKIESGKLELEQVPIDLRELVGDALKSLGERASVKNLELAWSVAPEVPAVVVGDAVRFRQILTNLVGNGIKFTALGEVVVEVESLGESPDGVPLRIRVRDTGIGIPPEKQERIFAPFEQGDSSTTRLFGGTGLGLAISSRLVQAMGGQIRVESVVGQGSTFEFTVVLGVADPALGDERAEGVQALRDLPVLIVDDNATNRRILVATLERWRLRVQSADSAASAMQLLESDYPDGVPLPLILTDVHMPSMDGFMFVEHLRQSPRFRDVVVIMLTSGAQSGDASRGETLRVAARLLKPVKQSELLRALLQAVVGKESSTLPSQPGPTDVASPETPPPAPRPQRQTLRILLAEDSLVNQKLTLALLEKWGNHVVIAANGLEAIEIWTTGKLDLILMDVQMPQCDGLEATRQIRRREQVRGGHIPIIAMTAKAMSGDRDLCMASGMDDYLTKPVRQRELAAAIIKFFPEASVAPLVPVATPSEVDLINWRDITQTIGGDARSVRTLAENCVVEATQILADLPQRLASGNFPEVCRLAHTVKSLGKTFGVTTLHDAGGQVEGAAARCDRDAAAALLPRLREVTLQMIADLKRWLQNNNSERR